MRKKKTPKRRFNVDPGAAQAERRELVKKLERGFQLVQESDEYRSYLNTVSRFHKYQPLVVLRQ